ncbi:hypothetical protein Bbelb_315700 [Branchiostoma belcheri]|nr:hypothetical protein Bbelb_315700 [Branchiostoma belcheri]
MYTWDIELQCSMWRETLPVGRTARTSTVPHMDGRREEMATSRPTCNQEGIQELREELEVLRTTSSVLDPGQDVRSAWTGSVLEVVTRQTETPQGAGAKVRPAAESADAAAPGCLRQHGLDEGPADIDTVLQVYRQSVLGTGENALHPGYFAYIPTGGLYPAALGDFLAAACGTYTGAYPLCPGGVEMENMLITWLAELLGYPQGHAGNISSGGTMATITALATARDSARLKAADFHRCVLYGSTLLHHSAEKALQAVGMAEATVRKVPLDAEFRMNVFSLEQQIMQDKEVRGLWLLAFHPKLPPPIPVLILPESASALPIKSPMSSPHLLLATVGTTDVGSVDPVDAIADVCRRHDVWLHVDGAYGGFFALVDDVKHLFRGVGRSDSVVLNPHKGLFVPCGAGVLIVREGGKLLRCCSSHRLGNYYSCLQLSHTELSPCQLSFEQTRHFRGPRLWLPLKLYGISAFRAALREKLLLARYFYQRLKETNLFELPLKPQLSVVVFRYATPPGEDTEYHNQRLLAAILSDGRVYLTPTTVGGAFFLRVCVLHFRSHLEHVDLCLTIIKQAAEHYDMKHMTALSSPLSLDPIRGSVRTWIDHSQGWSGFSCTVPSNITANRPVAKSEPTGKILTSRQDNILDRLSENGTKKLAAIFEIALRLENKSHPQTANLTTIRLCT